MEYMEARMQDYFESMENQLSEILEEGHDAYSNAIPASKNPYAEGSWMASAWNDGWSEAAKAADCTPLNTENADA